MDTILLEKLIPFREHIFSLYEGERLDNLVASIKQLGVLNPIITRPVGLTGTQEILSGHNRVNAAKLAGLEEIPYINAFPETDEEAMLIVIESNFMQRSLDEMKISERAKSIAKWHSCLSKQWERKDLLTEIERLKNDEIYQENQSDFSPSNTDEIRAEEGSRNCCVNEVLSPRSILNYVRISQLIDSLLKRVDMGLISIRAAVELSYLTVEQQQILDTVLSSDEKLKVTEKIAKELRLNAKKNKLTDVSVYESILKGEVLDKRRLPKRSIVLKERFLFQYFDKSLDDKIISSRLEQSLKLTEQTIPTILKNNKICAENYDEIVVEALEFYIANKD